MECVLLLYNTVGLLSDFINLNIYVSWGLLYSYLCLICLHQFTLSVSHSKDYKYIKIALQVSLFLFVVAAAAPIPVVVIFEWIFGILIAQNVTYFLLWQIVPPPHTIKWQVPVMVQITDMLSISLIDAGTACIFTSTLIYLSNVRIGGSFPSQTNLKRENNGVSVVLEMKGAEKRKLLRKKTGVGVVILHHIYALNHVTTSRTVALIVILLCKYSVAVIMTLFCVFWYFCMPSFPRVAESYSSRPDSVHILLFSSCVISACCKTLIYTFDGAI